MKGTIGHRGVRSRAGVLDLGPDPEAGKRRQEWPTARAACPVIRLHDLPQTRATALLARGLHPKVVAERLGHSQIGVTTDVYRHVTAPMMGEAAAKMDALLAPQLHVPS